MKQALTALAALAVPGTATAPAAAQEAEPPPIVVEGEKPQTEKALDELARDIAGNPRPRRPLARFEQPLCLMVAAGDTGMAQEVAERIIDNAKAAKVNVRGSGCKPNALLAFSDDAQAQLRAIRQSGRRLFAGISARDIDAAMGARDPVYVFQASKQTSASGEPIVSSPEAGGTNGIAGPQNVIWSAGRLKRLTREDLLAVLVVVDNAAIAGLTAVQIADYASLRLLAPTGEVDVAEAGAPRTIMTLFVAPDRAPTAMTRFDRAYLRSLYRLPAGSYAFEVLRAAVKETAKGAEDQE
ncbi:hypothetical protein [Erythrobacter donghaensis]|uniref:hypothetical protein n=1 Tax=Erythrobacter donghaensis TaxID=267135 RepID=UPI000A38FA7F|nr:hypothetical protein [Erythrobacter donghaensis]